MNFSDTFNMTDSVVHGFVVLKDQNGNTIFKKNNMVVRAGRDAVFNKICDSFYNKYKLLDDNKYSIVENYEAYTNGNVFAKGNVFSHFSKIAFGNSNKMTTLDTNSINEITLTGDEDSLYTINIDREDTDYSVSEKPQLVISFENTETYRCIIFEITLNAIEPAELTELGLFYKDINDTENLFSRVVFDPIFCGPNAAITELNLNYYLYF